MKYSLPEAQTLLLGLVDNFFFVVTSWPVWSVLLFYFSASLELSPAQPICSHTDYVYNH